MLFFRKNTLSPVNPSKQAIFVKPFSDYTLMNSNVPVESEMSLLGVLQFYLSIQWSEHSWKDYGILLRHT